jgi:hypothetical protein
MKSSLTAAPLLACGGDLGGDHAARHRAQQQPFPHAVMREAALFPLSGMVAGYALSWWLSSFETRAMRAPQDEVL